MQNNKPNTEYRDGQTTVLSRQQRQVSPSRSAVQLDNQSRSKGRENEFSAL